MRRDIEVSSTDDLIDLRDVTTRVEALEREWEETTGDTFTDYTLSEDDLVVGLGEESARELTLLRGLLGELRGYGGDHQWRGDWYPGSLIRDSYFTEYAEQLAVDIGAVNTEAGWPVSCIDWDEAADQLKQDYSTVEFGGVTYWYR